MNKIPVIIQLKKRQEGPIVWYEAWNLTDGCPVPIMGQHIPTIKQRVRNYFTHGEILSFEVDGEEK